ncbi:hypothetical protein FOIG_16721 [Fusarium odoratissimum NRRL 54006]|uniref:Uncharacterized protein n=1 Tax=Fusarium odoratissimum (strain NRRL 54006) TaxID=1089451 RepID=X0JYR3_FUSO5|nr:uncharacterized protein FOIG_16721 [Fusarium odoratissimum NRRL 54006]EXL89999.1 hypothetical protein FOIG_16721 [Fusarium odoratissimum NRRL 54006]
MSRRARTIGELTRTRARRRQRSWTAIDSKF